MRLEILNRAYILVANARFKVIISVYEDACKINILILKFFVSGMV